MAATRNRPSPDPDTRLGRVLASRLRAWLGESGSRRHRVEVAFSGGRDSVALLHVLAGLRDAQGLDISALHVHHGLSPNADRWVAFAENFCKSLSVPLQVVRVFVPENSPLGIEGAARAERYRVFSGSQADLLLLAHHQDDQAETLLFNLLRGTGVHGAAAMPMLRRIGRSGASGQEPLRLGRPWLEVSRAEIDAYLAGRDLPHVDDESNRDISFSRNHLRHEVFPRLTDHHPQATKSLAAAARRFGDAANLLDALAEIDLALVRSGDQLDWASAQSLDETRQKNLLRYWLSRSGGGVSSEASLSEFLRQCREGASDSAVSMVFGAIHLYRWQNRLYRVPATREIEPALVVWQGEISTPWCGGKVLMQAISGEGLRRNALIGRVELRPRQGSERIRLRPDGPSRPVRLLFQERGIPPWERPTTPFLWVNERLAAVGGVGVAAEFAASGHQPALSFDWLAAQTVI